MILELIIIGIFAGFITHTKSKFTRLAGSALITYMALLIYWLVGIFYNNQYEPEMLLGWLFMSTLGCALVLPISYFLGLVLLKYRGKAT